MSKVFPDPNLLLISAFPRMLLLQIHGFLALALLCSPAEWEKSQGGTFLRLPSILDITIFLIFIRALKFWRFTIPVCLRSAKLDRYGYPLLSE